MHFLRAQHPSSTEEPRHVSRVNCITQTNTEVHCYLGMEHYATLKSYHNDHELRLGFTDFCRRLFYAELGSS